LLPLSFYFGLDMSQSPKQSPESTWTSAVGSPKAVGTYRVTVPVWFIFRR